MYTYIYIDDICIYIYTHIYNIYIYNMHTSRLQTANIGPVSSRLCATRQRPGSPAPWPGWPDQIWPETSRVSMGFYWYLVGSWYHDDVWSFFLWKLSLSMDLNQHDLGTTGTIAVTFSKKDGLNCHLTTNHCIFSFRKQSCVLLINTHITVYIYIESLEIKT